MAKIGWAYCLWILDLGPESDYDLSRIDVAHLNGVAVILNDGETVAKPERRNYFMNSDYVRRSSSS